jgi:hypothetical protein
MGWHHQWNLSSRVCHTTRRNYQSTEFCFQKKLKINIHSNVYTGSLPSAPLAFSLSFPLSLFCWLSIFSFNVCVFLSLYFCLSLCSLVSHSVLLFTSFCIFFALSFHLFFITTFHFFSVCDSLFLCSCENVLTSQYLWICERGKRKRKRKRGTFGNYCCD